MKTRIAAAGVAVTLTTVGVLIPTPAHAAYSYLVMVKSDSSNGTKRLRVYPDSGRCNGASVVISGGHQTYGRSFKSEAWDITAKTSLGVRFGVSAGSCSGPENHSGVTAWRVFEFPPGGRD